MPRAGGISLLELLVTVAVAGVLLSTGVPGFRALVQDNRRAAAVNLFVRSLHLARSEAVKRARYVTLCKTGGGGNCVGGNVPWSDGWITFVNDDGDEPPRVDAGEEVLLRQPPLAEVTVTGNRDGFTFRPFYQRSTNGTLVFCDARGAAAARAIIVSQTGRPRISERSAAGGPLVCG